MDPEIKRLTELRRFLRGNLRRTESGCLEYVGVKRGPVPENPLICVRLKGRNSTMLLRRWIWEEHENKRLPSGYYIVMSCKNRKCHAIQHMIVSRHFRPYQNNFMLANSELFSDENIRMIRYFQGLINATILSSWFGIGVFHVYRIWKGKIYSEVLQPKDFAPSPKWQRKGEIASLHTSTGHYLSENNKEIALRDIRSSDLPFHAKQRLLLYAKGLPLIEIGKRLDRSRETIHDSIHIYLPRLYKQLPNREWLKLLNKKGR
jgi:hypothetical protein